MRTLRVEICALESEIQEKEKELRRDRTRNNQDAIQRIENLLVELRAKLRTKSKLYEKLELRLRKLLGFQ